jgi:pimeloyl-ACP methyl ester carboxylesterase
MAAGSGQMQAGPPARREVFRAASDDEVGGMDVDVRGLTIHYKVVGEGRPIVMLHGGGLDHRHMMAEMEPLFRRHPGWKRIYPDLPGSGSTGTKDWIVTQEDVLDLVLAFIDTVIPGEEFAIAGTSRGGYLARGVIYKRGSSVSGALLVTPAGAEKGSAPVPDHMTLAEDSSLQQELKPSETDHFGLLVVQSRAALDKMRSYYYPALAIRDQALRDRIVANYDLPFDVNALSVPFVKPALIICGRQDDVTGYLDAWKMTSVFPRATFAVLDKTGHLVNLEQSGLFEALAGEWLERLEDSVAPR